MLGGVRGGDGYLRTNRRLEWWLMPGSVGQFTAIGENSFTNFLVGDFTRPRLISATSAVGSTTRVDQWAGGPGNKVHVARGQGWVTVSSPVEGVSHVTVVAPDVVLPAERAKSAMIYWIDAQFGLPTPAIIPAGTKQSLTTTVWRQSNHCPRPGWIVRMKRPAVLRPSLPRRARRRSRCRPMRPARRAWRSSRRIPRRARARCASRSSARPIHAASG